MKLELLETLRAKLIAEDPLDEVVLYFYDNFVGQGELPRLSVAVEGSFLEDMLPLTVNGMLDKEVAITGLHIMSVPQFSFVHGTFWAGGCVGTVIYFADVEMGLVSLSDPITDNAYISRFRMASLSQEAHQSLN